MSNLQNSDILDIDVKDISWIYMMNKKAPWEFNTSRHKSEEIIPNQYNLIYICSGSYKTTYANGHLGYIEKGNLLLTRKKEMDYINNSIELPLLYYSITFTTDKPIPDDYFVYERKTVFPKHPDKVESLFVNSYNTFTTKPKTWRMDIKAYVLRILSIFFKEFYFIDEQKNMPSSMLKAIKSIEENIYEENINISGLAKEVNVSVDYFSRLFKKTFGTTPKKYILNMKLERAAALLSSSDKSVTEVCYACGFSTISYFNNAFKEKYKTTPGKFKQSYDIMQL